MITFKQGSLTNVRYATGDDNAHLVSVLTTEHGLLAQLKREFQQLQGTRLVNADNIYYVIIFQADEDYIEQLHNLVVQFVLKWSSKNEEKGQNLDF